MSKLTDWKTLITSAMDNVGESWIDVVHATFTGDELTQRFDNGYGGSEGCAFTLWTKKRVYFPVVYDGSEWVGSAPRDPCDEKTDHMGGG